MTEELRDAPGVHGLPHAIPAIDVEEDEPVTFDSDGFSVSNEIHVLASDAGVGKTTMSVAIAGAQAAEHAVFDRFPCRKPGPVLLVSEEDSEGILRNRLQALCGGHGWPLAQVLNRVHFLCLAGIRVDQAHWQAHLLHEVERTRARAVIIDPWYDVIGGEENSNSEIRPAIQFLRRLAAVATVYVSAHAGKASPDKRKIDRIRGASALFSAARVVYFLEADDRGIAVHPLKFSRGELPERFVIQRTIETDPENAASWTSARLTMLTAEKAQEVGAKRLVRTTLERAPGSSSTELKNAAIGTGITAIEMSAAIKDLEHEGEIAFDPGPRNSKLWRLTSDKLSSLPTNGRQARQGSLPGCSDLAGQAQDASRQPALPLEGQGEAGSRRQDGQGAETDPTELLAEASE